jgi:outer membrane protein assembly factor BamB
VGEPLRYSFQFGVIHAHSFALLLTLATGSLSAADWSRFRGPNGGGVADDTGLPIEFSPDKNVVWKTEISKGHSSPVFGEDAIFLTGWEGKSVFTFALDRETGRILWRREVVRNREGKLHDSNGPDGNERWRIPLGPFNNPMGMGASPILVEGKIIQICDSESDSFMIAVAKDTG